MPTSVVPTPAVRRRKLRFASFQEVLEEVEALHAQPHQQLGNWPLPVAAGHLAAAINASIDGGTFPVRWYYKLLGPWVIKPRLLRSFPAGFQLPRVARKLLIPEQQIHFDDALAQLRTAIDRLQTEQQRGTHPVLGALTVDEWNRFHLRHAELHLGFLVPA